MAIRGGGGGRKSHYHAYKQLFFIHFRGMLGLSSENFTHIKKEMVTI